MRMPLQISHGGTNPLWTYHSVVDRERKGFGAQAYDPVLHETLKWQAGHYRTRFFNSIDRLDRIIAVAFSIAFGAGLIVFHYRIYPLDFALPIFFELAGFVALVISNEIFALAAYCDFLDKQLASLLDCRPSSRDFYIPWPSDSVGPVTRFNVSVLASDVLYSATLLGASIASLTVGWLHYKHLQWIAASSLAVFLLVVTVESFAFYQVFQVYDYVSGLLETQKGDRWLQVHQDDKTHYENVARFSAPETYWWSIKKMRTSRRGSI